ncbi:MAG: tetratricopeptide repeat protein [Sedimentisphaerales bacterium]|nr:tetratricopeptide repeat protein [Sedimentisphaerales bacterium]
MRKKRSSTGAFNFTQSMLGSLIYALLDFNTGFTEALNSTGVAIPALLISIGTFLGLDKWSKWKEAKNDNEKLNAFRDLMLSQIKKKQEVLEEDFARKEFDNDEDHKQFVNNFKMLKQIIIEIRKNLKETQITVEEVRSALQNHIKTHEQMRKLFPINNIPYLSLGDLFKGREDDFNKLVEHIEKESQVTAITQDKGLSIKAIHGLGGIGKTRLAIEYGWYALEKGFYKAVLFVNCSQQLTDNKEASETERQIRKESAVERLYVEIAKLAAADLLDIDGCDNLKSQEAFQQVIKELHSRKDWLIVFDNVDDFDMCNAIKQILPSLKNGRIIITSRLSNWTGNIKPLHLDRLSIESSTDYLLQKTKDKRPACGNDNEKVKELAEKLDGLPVALEQAAAYISYNTLTFEQYLKDFEEVELEVLGFDAKKLSMADYDKPVLRTWAMTEKKLDANARAILTISAFLAPDNIPNSLLINQSNIVLVISGFLEQVSQEELKNILESKGNPRTIRNALAQLSSYSMISLNISDESFSIHRLVQEVARLRLSKENIEFFTQFILTMIHNDYPANEKTIKTNYSWDKTMDRHISEIIAFANRLWPEIFSIPKAVIGLLAKQINDLSQFYHFQARFSEEELLITRALEICEKSFGKKHPNFAISINNLALLYLATNRLKEAEPLMKQAIEIFEKSFGKEHPNVATSMNNLAQLYQATNRLQEAETLMKRALEIYEKSFGKDHPNVATAMNNLAGLYMDTNRLKEAEPLMKRAIEIDEKSFGKDHPNVARAMINLATFYRVTNRLKEAEPLMKHAIEIDEKSFGKDHPDVGRDLNNLAVLYMNTNRLQEAETLLKRSLEIDEKSFGKDHPNVAIRLNNLAALYEATNRLKEAELLIKRALEIDEKSFGNDHPNVATSMNNIALLYMNTKRLKEAELLMKHAIEIDEKSFGKDHRNIARDLNNLAKLYQNTNRLKEAEPLMKRVLEINEKSFGKDHPDVAMCLNNLAMLYKDTIRLQEAEPLMERSLLIIIRFTRQTGHPHPHLETAIDNFASLLIQIGYSKEQVHERLKKLMPELFG